MSDQSQLPDAVPMEDRAPGPDKFAVAVLMRCTPTPENRWIDARWDVIGVLPARLAATRDPLPATVDPAPHRISRHDGLTMALHPDECESYYHNLMVEDPRCFVVCRDDEQEVPQPILVTASFDEANAYAEGDERVDSVPMAPDLLAAIESFVLNHYVPTKRLKRKRQDWQPA